MKLRNKKTGEIIEAESCNNTGGCISIYYEEKGGQIGTKDCFTSLAELNEEWQDYEEPKDFWYIDDYDIMCGSVGPVYNPGYCIYTEEQVEKLKAIGNYFETKEEAEKALEKLKAWTRLKENGFEFYGWDLDADDEDINASFGSKLCKGNKVYDFVKDLDLLFGGNNGD